jgi:ligand-binding sensor domain-containing protein
VLLLLSVVNSLGQTLGVGTLNRDNGLAGSTVLDFFKDSHGIMYIGTSVGLSSFDGEHVENVQFTGNESGGLAWVTAIAEPDDGHLLLGTKHGLFLFDKSTRSVKRVFEDEMGFEVLGMVGTTDHIIYLGTTHGVYRYEDGKLSPAPFRAPDGDRNVIDISLTVTRQGEQLWVLYAGGVLGVSLKGRSHPEWRPWNRQAGMLTSMAPLNDGRTVVGTNGNGLCVFSRTTGRWTPFQLPGQGISSLKTDGHSYLLCATQASGVVELELPSARIRRIFSKSVFQGEHVPVRFDTPSKIYRDSLGITWIGYVFFGVDYTLYNRSIFKNYTLPGVFDSDGLQVRSFLVDGDRVLVGTREGLYVTDRRRNTSVYLSPERLGAHIVSQAKRVGNRYLVATISGGLVVLDRESLRQKTVAGQSLFRGANIYDLQTDAKGRVWFSSSAGVGCYDPMRRQISQYNYANSHLPNNEVFCLGFDALGNGWASTFAGLCSFDAERGTFSTADLPKALTELGRLNAIYTSKGRTYFIPQLGCPRRLRCPDGPHGEEAVSGVHRQARVLLSLRPRRGQLHLCHGRRRLSDLASRTAQVCSHGRTEQFRTAESGHGRDWR